MTGDGQRAQASRRGAKSNLQLSRRRSAEAAAALGLPHARNVRQGTEDNTQTNAARRAAHNVAADGVELEVEFSCGGEAAVP